MKKCAMLTMDCLDEFGVYDHLLIEPLAELGWQTEFVSWRNTRVDWDHFDVVVIRSPWDYQDEPDAFLAVLEKIEKSSAILENSLEIVRNNIDKRYLKKLASDGVNIVPSLWQEDFDYKYLLTAFEHFSTQQLIVKPCISANADNTFWLTQETIASKKEELEQVFSDRPFIIQPFIKNILAEGEYSLFYFNGNYSHAILKTPANGDFRVQEEHGGQLKKIEPEMKLKLQAEKTLSAYNEVPLYARFDYVRYEDHFALMEAELIEPSLYFNMDEESPKRFAEAFVERFDS